MRILEPSVDGVLDALREVIDPELGENVVDLGLVYGIDVEGGQVTVRMTLTTPNCPLQASLGAAVRRAVELFVPGAQSVSVELVWEPRWTPERVSPEARARLGWR